jgi:hypothetical protein
MTVVAFDTLKLAQALREADFTPAQAEGAAEAIAAAIQSDLATKSDLALMKADLTGLIAESKAKLRASIADTEAKLRTSITETEAKLRASITETEAKLTVAIANGKTELLKWMFGTIGFQTIVILGAVFALAHATR